MCARTTSPRLQMWFKSTAVSRHLTNRFAVPGLRTPHTGKKIKKVAGLFKKGEVVQCNKCDAWMQAPLDEPVSGLRCAEPTGKCRALIWAPGADDTRKKASGSKQTVGL